MGRRGPAPIPTVEKVRRGNPGKRPLNENEPTPDPILPDCPDFLDANAHEEWARLAQELNDLGLLTRIDRNALAAYCEAFSMFKRSTEHINQFGPWQIVNAKYDADGKRITGTGMMAPSPAIRVHREAMGQMKTLGAELGLSPAARSRINVDPRKDGGDEAFFDAPPRKPTLVVNNDGGDDAADESDT